MLKITKHKFFENRYVVYDRTTCLGDIIFLAAHARFYGDDNYDGIELSHMKEITAFMENLSSGKGC